MTNTPILSFKESLDMTDGEKRHLFLGNGFSIALFPKIFAYKRLFDSANFEDIPESQQVFSILETTDFEVVIQALRLTSKVLPPFMSTHAGITAKMNSQAEKIKELLIHAIADNHPENPGHIEENQFLSCRKFLSYFISESLPRNFQGNIFTSSYDLLLYWAMMHDNEREDGNNAKIILSHDDGFRTPEDNFDAEYVVWDGFSNYQNIRYLHGGLHIFDDGCDLRKFCWERSGGIPLIDQIRTALEQKKFPLFVSEGSTDEKIKKIRHSHVYLQSSLKSLANLGNNLFIYGHSLADNDDHLINLIPKSKVKAIFISIYGDPKNTSNKRIITKALSLPTKRKNKVALDVHFFDASTAHVWDS